MDILLVTVPRINKKKKKLFKFSEIVGFHLFVSIQAYSFIYRSKISFNYFFLERFMTWWISCRIIIIIQWCQLKLKLNKFEPMRMSHIFNQCNPLRNEMQTKASTLNKWFAFVIKKYSHDSFFFIQMFAPGHANTHAI